MDEFLRQLLIDKGLPEDIDPEVRSQLLRDLSSRAADLINRRLIDALSEQDVAMLDKLIDEKPDDANAYLQFINDHVADKENITASALLEFRALYLGKDA